MTHCTPKALPPQAAPGPGVQTKLCSGSRIGLCMELYPIGFRNAVCLGLMVEMLQGQLPEGPRLPAPVCPDGGSARRFQAPTSKPLFLILLLQAGLLRAAEVLLVLLMQGCAHHSADCRESGCDPVRLARLSKVEVCEFRLCAAVC